MFPGVYTEGAQVALGQEGVVLVPDRDGSHGSATPHSSLRLGEERHTEVAAVAPAPHSDVLRVYVGKGTNPPARRPSSLVREILR